MTRHIKLMWADGRPLSFTISQGRRFDSVHQHCLFFNISTGKFAMCLSSVGALLISYPCVNSGKSAVQLRHLGIASYSWQTMAILPGRKVSSDVYICWFRTLVTLNQSDSYLIGIGSLKKAIIFGKCIIKGAWPFAYIGWILGKSDSILTRTITVRLTSSFGNQSKGLW